MQILKLIQQNLSIRLVDNGYRIKSPNSESTVYWADLLEWRENSEYLLLYFGPKLFHMVPKRLFDLGLNIDQIKMYLHDNVGVST